MTGFILSLTVITETQVVSLSQSSVAVNVIVYSPVSPQAGTRTAGKVLVISTSEQASVAVAVASQVVIIASWFGLLCDG